MRRVVILVAAALAIFAAGYVTHTAPGTTVTVVNHPPGPAPEGSATAAPPGAPPDYQALKNQLAICMAFHPPAEEADHELHKQLAMCQGELDVRKNPPTLPQCYEFADAVATYDRELGETNPSPATLERAAHLTVEECGRVLEYVTRASSKRLACLGGKMVPLGWKERYGAPLSARPLVKACYALPKDVRTNAYFGYQEELVREAGGKVMRSMRMTPDGGLWDGPGVDAERDE